MSLIETITELRQDFEGVSELTSEELLAICTKMRLEEVDKRYEKEFDRLLLSLNQDCANERDFVKLSESINALSTILLSLYNTLTDHIKFYS